MGFLSAANSKTMEVTEVKSAIRWRTKILAGISLCVSATLFLGAFGIALVSSTNTSTVIETPQPTISNPSLPCVDPAPAFSGVVPGTSKPAGCEKSRYAPGEILIQFKTDQSANDLQKYLIARNSLISPIPNSIVDISRRYRLKSFQTLYKATPSTRGGGLQKPARTYKLTFPKDIQLNDLVASYAASDEVAYVEPNYFYDATINHIAQPNSVAPLIRSTVDDVTWIPDDRFYQSAESWGQPYDDQWNLKRVDAEGAWQVTTGERRVVIAVIDTGIDYTHPDLVGQVWVNPHERPGNNIDDDRNGFIDDVRGWDFANNDSGVNDAHGHGTHVAGTIGATTNNELGIAGMSWDTQVMALKGLGDSGGGYADDLAASIIYAVDNGADVINMSWGSRERSLVITDAIAYATNRNVVLVAASGNNGSADSLLYPANEEDVMAVGAWCPSNYSNAYCAPDQNGSWAAFSNYGEKVDLVAPGVDILSLRSAGTDMYRNGLQIVQDIYYRSTGTSMAAPHVSGLAGLLLSRWPNLTTAQVRFILRSGATDVGEAGIDKKSGWGIMNARNALQLAEQISKDMSAELVMQEANATWVNERDGRIEFTITNIGWAPSQGTTYQLYSDSITGEILATGNVPPLDIGARASFLETFTLNNVPSLRLFLVTNYDRRTPEIEFRNNEKHIALSLPRLVGWPPENFDNFVSPLAAADIDNNGDLEIIAGTFTHQASPYGNSDWKVYAWHHDGQLVSGWPVSVDGYVLNYSEPVIGDTNHDGRQEIYVVTGAPTRIFGWYADGQPIPGWPKTPRLDYVEVIGVSLADLDADGDEEILAGPWAWHSDGTLVAGWPLPDAEYGEIRITTQWAIDDVDRDGRVELFAGAVEYPNADINGVLGVYAWRGDGVRVPGWPKETDRGFGYSTPAIGDINADGRLDIVAASPGEPGILYAWEADGNAIPGWPISVGVFGGGSSPIIVDVDQDGEAEVVFGTSLDPQTLETSLYAWHGNGQLVSGWPVTPGVVRTPSVGEIVAADIFGDDKLEIIGPYGEGVYAWDYAGTPVPGFPLYTGPIGITSLYGSAVVVDLDGNRNLDVIIGGGIPNNAPTWIPLQDLPRSVHAWTTIKQHQEPSTPWDTAHQDNRRTGRYDSSSPIVEITSPQQNDSIIGSTLAVSAVINETSQVRKVEYLVDGNVMSTGTVSCSKILSSRCLAQNALNISTISYGPHQLQVRVIDNYGNVGLSSTHVFQFTPPSGGGGRTLIPKEVE